MSWQEGKILERNWLEELNRSFVMPEDYAKHNLMARREFFKLSCEDLPRRGQDQFTLLRDLTHRVRCGGVTLVTLVTLICIKFAGNGFYMGLCRNTVTYRHTNLTLQNVYPPDFYVPP